MGMSQSAPPSQLQSNTTHVYCTPQQRPAATTQLIVTDLLYSSRRSEHRRPAPRPQRGTLQSVSARGPDRLHELVRQSCAASSLMHWGGEDPSRTARHRRFMPRGDTRLSARCTDARTRSVAACRGSAGAPMIAVPPDGPRRATAHPSELSLLSTHFDGLWECHHRGFRGH